MNKKLLFLILFSAVCISAGYFVARELSRPVSSVTVSDPQSSSVKPSAEVPQIQNIQAQATQKTIATAESSIDQKIQQNVPFSVQAPFGNWKDPIFQNACEEDSIIMSMGWVNSAASISPQEAQKQILTIVDFENKTFGYNADTDIHDMQKIFQNYFNYQGTKVQENISLSDIKNELQNGNIVLVPAFGRALGNPNYTAPGPIDHMLVVIGYDPAAKEFITNDSGTRHGAGYRYAENILFDAIWEYPSGSAATLSPVGELKKGMIIVSKPQ